MQVVDLARRIWGKVRGSGKMIVFIAICFRYL